MLFLHQVPLGSLGPWGWGHLHPSLCIVSPKDGICSWACAAPPGAQKTRAAPGPTVGEMD